MTRLLGNEPYFPRDIVLGDQCQFWGMRSRRAEVPSGGPYVFGMAWMILTVPEGSLKPTHSWGCTTDPIASSGTRVVGLP